MRLVGVGLALAGIVALTVVGPGGATSASVPSATFRVAVPTAGDVTVATAIFGLQGVHVPKTLHPRLRVHNAPQLGKDVVVVASARQEARDRSKLDVTAVVIRRGVRKKSAAGQRIGAADAVLVIDEPDLAGAKPQDQLMRTASVVSTNVVQGNFLPQFPSDCGSGNASFLTGAPAGLPSAGSTEEFSCGLALDQVWMPPSFAVSIGAFWCGAPTRPPARGSKTYEVHVDCTGAVSAFAVQDPGKADNVTVLKLLGLTGTCTAPFGKPYEGLCRLGSPLVTLTPGAFDMTLARALPSGAEFGMTVPQGSTQASFPIRVIDVVRAGTDIVDLLNNPSYGGAYHTLLTQAREALIKGDIPAACKILQDLQARAEYDIHAPGISASRFQEALVFLDCNAR